MNRKLQLALTFLATVTVQMFAFPSTVLAETTVTADPVFSDCRDKLDPPTDGNTVYRYVVLDTLAKCNKSAEGGKTAVSGTYRDVYRTQPSDAPIEPYLSCSLGDDDVVSCHLSPVSETGQLFYTWRVDGPITHLEGERDQAYHKAHFQCVSGSSGVATIVATVTSREAPTEIEVTRTVECLLDYEIVDPPFDPGVNY